MYIKNARLLTQNLINGKYPLAVGTDQATIDNCKTSGGCQQLAYVRGHEHMLGQGAAILKKPPHPQAASVFVNWFLTKEGQDAFIKGIADTEPKRRECAQHPRGRGAASGSPRNSARVSDDSQLDKYSLQGMEQGAEEMQKVMDLYRKVESGQPRKARRCAVRLPVIAAHLVIREHTIPRHVQNIFANRSVSSRMTAAAFAVAHERL